MNLFIVDLKHQPGELAKACDAIAKKGIDITAFSGVTCGDSGTVALLTNDDSGTRNALADAGFRAREHEVVTTTIENTPGTSSGFSTTVPLKRSGKGTRYHS